MTALEIDSVIQLYLLANNASARLTTEAHRSDQRLHRLVLHANMLDRLTSEIDQREKQQSTPRSIGSSSSDDEFYALSVRAAPKQRKKKVKPSARVAHRPEALVA